jgi:uncharacterized protein YjbI with pentapeptide repeats
MKCQFRNCEEESWQNSVFCVLHKDLLFVSNFDRFSSEFYNFIDLFTKKNAAINEKINKNDYNFTGARLVQLNLSGKKIEGNLDLSETKILDDVNINNTVINGTVSLIMAEIGGKLFCDSKYEHSNRTFIKGSFLLQGAHIQRGVFFRNIEVRDDVKLWSTKMDEFVWFTNAKIGRDLWLLDTKIGKFIDFGRASFGRFVDIRSSTFYGYVNFEYTIFEGDVLFDESMFNEHVFFKRAKFFEGAVFEDVKFNKLVSFERVLFEGVTYFIQNSSFNVFNNYVFFNDSSFSTRGIFEGIKNLVADFEGGRLKNVVFRNCDLSKTRFKDVIFDNCELSTSNLPNKIIEHKEYEYSKELNFDLIKFSSKMTPITCLVLSQTASAPCMTIISSYDKVSNAQKVADIYRRIKQCLESQGSYIEASEFYVKEMDMRNEVYWSENKIKWLFYKFLSLITRYGENSKRLAGFIILYYVSLLLIVLICNISPSHPYFVVFNIAIIPVGSFLMALFVYVFARKMAR